MYNKEEARENIEKLSENFGEKLYLIKTSGQYKEAQIEDEFIKPLFKYLNWNISNEGINNFSDREFIVQAQGRKGKEPDYLLKLNNIPRFYIEAKHSKYYLGGKTDDKGKIKERTDYIWQAYSYAYSTQTRPQYEKVDFALLTDFEEFRFFDCTFAVKNPELINNYCIIDWTYKDYIEKFDELWDYFERENVRNNSLGKLYISEKKIKENRISPDKAFLKDLDDENNGWRIKLAKDIKKYHSDLSSELITQAVQLILDRFIFIKVLADREIEEDYIQTIVKKIQSIKDQENGIVYDECSDIFKQLDKTYNGSVFIKRLELDTVKVSNKILIEILKDFLPENSRYNFKVIPVEILGTIYEQFLGKIVVTTEKRAKIDYKPDIRKAGGVYYTPDYIVNYIVELTVGEKLKECKKYEDLLEIKICDPACGSGSFLIAAYDYLIKWTVKYFEKKVKNGSSGTELKGLSKEEKNLVYLDEMNNVRLTSKIKRDILRSCIYGIDIDTQAVEVTKMSLSLKTLEDTTHFEVYNERTLFHSTILPPLEGNIKCANSLIDREKLLELNMFGIEGLKAFDWKDVSGFGNIFQKKGGFDCIIGNPPYIKTQELQQSHPEEINLYKKIYKSAMSGNTDIYILFIEKSLFLLSEKGILGFICPHKFFNSGYGKELRTIISQGKNLNRIINFGVNQIFNSVSTYTCLLFLSKVKNEKFLFYEFKEEDNNISEKMKNIEYFEISTEKVSSNDWVFIDSDNESWISKIKLNKLTLGDITSNIFQGPKSGADPVFIFELVKKGKSISTFYSNSLEEEFKIENKIVTQYVKGKNIQRYIIKKNNEYTLFPYLGSNLISERDLHSKYPLAYSYLTNKKNKSILLEREEGRFKKNWWSYSRPQNMNIVYSEKLLTPFNAFNSSFAMDIEKDFIFSAGVSGAYGILLKPELNLSYEYLLGILNSKLMERFLRTISTALRGSYYSYENKYIRQLPIYIPDLKYKRKYDKCKLIEEYSKKIIEFKKFGKDEDAQFLDNKIDSLVSEIYDF